MPFRAALFDLDGTLLDTLEDIADSANRALGRHGFATHPIPAYKYFVGDGVTRLFERSLPEASRTPEMVRACIATYKEDYARNWANKSRPYAGVPQLLDGLVQRGLRLAVLSNKPHDFTVQCVTTLLPRWRFDVVLGASEAFAHKPDPAAAIHIANQIDVKPADVLYVGDTATDMKTAVAAGMYPAGALWGFRTADELHAAGAQSLHERPTDVLTLL